jgi:multiple sugar transport system substrate-binding protein
LNKVDSKKYSVESMGRRLLILVIILTLVGGCTRQDVTLTFAVGGAPSEIDYWEKLVEEFERTYQIKVRLLRQPTDTDQRRQGLVVPLSSKKSDPDVFLMDVAWVAQFAASGWLTSLDPYIKNDNFDTSKFFTSILNQVDIYKGKLLALPVYIDCGLLYYRDDLLIKYGYKPPSTWSQLLEYAQDIQQQEQKSNPHFYGFVWQGAQYEGLVCTWLEFTYSFGGRILDSKGNITLTSEENIRALQFMTDLIQNYRISPPNTYTEMKEEEVRMAFQSGNALFQRNWPYAWMLHQAPDSPIKGRFGVTILPKSQGGRHVAALGGWHIGISRYSDAKQNAWRFLKFVLSYSIQKKLVLNLGWNPARQDLYDDPQIKEEIPHINVLKTAFGNAIARPPLPYYTQISSVLQRYLNAAISGKLQPAEALQQAEAQIKRLVDIYRE